MLKKIILILISILSISVAWSKAIIDPDVNASINTSGLKATPAAQATPISTLVFLNSQAETARFIANLKQLPGVLTKKFDGLPVVLVLLPPDRRVLNTIANDPAAMQISSWRNGQEELEFSEQAILLRSSSFFPTVSNWWDYGYTGQHSVVGLIDSGIATEHPGLAQKQLIIRKEAGSGYNNFKNGVRTAHGTGVACIYAGSGTAAFPNEFGIVRDAPTIVAGFAGDGGNDIENLSQTLGTLEWMLNRAEIKPDVINYSFGNGPTNCINCPDWSGLAKMVDYVVNHEHILWVKSAGNNGYVASSSEAPFVGTMTSPADNYNAITVANINPVVNHAGLVSLNPRELHAIRYTSSRGPTLNGRKKPDISAPGNDTRTCAPDPTIYPQQYTTAMDYHDGYRLMGGTSSAAPHVGAASLLLQEAGIISPMAKKALLINSADAYTDSDQPGPDDPQHPYQGGHYPVMGSEWNRTYGWGYLNMQKAYDERENLIEDALTIEHPEKIYRVNLAVGDKITLVHERRVGYSDDGREWKLSHLILEVIDPNTHEVILRDESAQDTVHQVANCQRNKNEPLCSSATKPLQVLVKVRLLDETIEGANEEPFALVASSSLTPVSKQPM